MYLSRIQLNPQNRHTMVALVNPQKIHGAVYIKAPRFDMLLHGKRDGRIVLYDEYAIGHCFSFPTTKRGIAKWDPLFCVIVTGDLPYTALLRPRTDRQGSRLRNTGWCGR